MRNLKKAEVRYFIYKIFSSPFGKVPWLIDGNFSLGESRAIAQYLVDSKAPGNSLYPTDLKSRALINSRLYYDATVIYQKAHEVMVSLKHNLI